MKLSSLLAVTLCLTPMSLGALAWTPITSRRTIRSSTLLSPLRSAAENDPSTITKRNAVSQTQQSRRDWFRGVAVNTAAATLALLPATATFAATTTATTAPPALVTSAAVCDPTVSVWKHDNRIIYLLGTAHISETSADLAAQLVRDVAPTGVFVELDLKRVGGLPQQGQSVSRVNMGQASDTDSIDTVLASAGVPASRVVVPAMATTSSPALVAADGSTTAQLPIAQQEPRGMQARALNFGAAQVGNAIKGMYKNLDQQGFKPGNEFVAAVQEGQKIGSAIILGDQDVEVTLRRLVQALAATDLSKLTDPNSEVNQSMQELLPSGATDPNQPTMNKDDLSILVESMKTRDRVREIMGQLKKVAPELVNVMLTERDAYMAAGLDTLNQFTSIVAVMGIAHVDGVEQNLRNRGWTQVTPRCPPKTMIR